MIVQPVPAQDPLPFLDPLQLALDGLGPQPGGRYRRHGTGTIATVLRVEQRRKAWVTIRILGTDQTLTLAGFLANFEPYTRSRETA